MSRHERNLLLLLTLSSLRLLCHLTVPTPPPAKGFAVVDGQRSRINWAVACAATTIIRGAKDCGKEPFQEFLLANAWHLVDGEQVECGGNLDGP